MCHNTLNSFADNQSTAANVSFGVLCWQAKLLKAGGAEKKKDNKVSSGVKLKKTAAKNKLTSEMLKMIKKGDDER